MIMSHTAAQSRRGSADVGEQSALTSRGQAVRVAWFAGLSVALGTAAVVAGVSSALLPFILALGPTVIALILAWREGDGALGRLLRTALTRPSRRAWYALVGLPVVWALATIGISVAMGQPTSGLFDKVVPAILIVPLVVLLPAFAEEIAWRGYAVSRLLPSMSPLAAALALAGPWIVLHVFLQLPGQMNAGLALWPTVLSLAAYSVILTWIFVASGGSVLLTALVHAGFNGVVPLMGGLEIDRAWAIRAVLVAVVAIGLVAYGQLRDRPTGRSGRGGVPGRRDDIRRPASRDATGLLLMSALGGNRAVDLMIGPRR